MSGFKPYDASSSGSGGSGGGGVFQPEQRNIEDISSGQSLNLLTVTAPTGKVIKINYLATGGNTSQAGISLIINGNTLIDTKTLLDRTPSSTGGAFFGVGVLGDAPFLSNQNVFQEIYCTSFALNKVGSPTTQIITCTYEIGEVK
mgnify:CR=1 FL=1|tara:strand:+ start:392 stop:826 length:435 start_codon:yes stop_codon:yes gene_type:complete